MARVTIDSEYLYQLQQDLERSRHDADMFRDAWMRGDKKKSEIGIEINGTKCKLVATKGKILLDFGSFKMPFLTIDVLSLEQLGVDPYEIVLQFLDQVNFINQPKEQIK